MQLLALPTSAAQLSLTQRRTPPVSRSVPLATSRQRFSWARTMGPVLTSGVLDVYCIFCSRADNPTGMMILRSGTIRYATKSLTWRLTHKQRTWVDRSKTFSRACSIRTRPSDAILTKYLATSGCIKTQVIWQQQLMNERKNLWFGPFSKGASPNCINCNINLNLALTEILDRKIE